jgi:hypothetical protein
MTIQGAQSCTICYANNDFVLCGYVLVVNRVTVTFFMFLNDMKIFWKRGTIQIFGDNSNKSGTR